MTKKSARRELDLIAELQRDYGFMILKMPTSRDRLVQGFNRGGRKLRFYVAVQMRLVVPEKSALGRSMKKLYARDEKAGAK